MSQSRPIKVFPIWPADPAGDADAVKGTLTSFTFDLVEDPGALGTDAQRWVFEGSLEKGKWILKDTVPWTHAGALNARTTLNSTPLAASAPA